MKQYNILGGIDELKNDYKTIDENRYYGSDLNKFVAEQCRKDMVVMNIDLVISDYKNNNIKLIESKYPNEKLGKGQELTYRKLSSLGFDVYVIYGAPPYKAAEIYSFKTNKRNIVDNTELINFLNNKHDNL